MRVKWSRFDQLSLEGLLWALPAVALLNVVVHAVRAVRGERLLSTGELPRELVSAGGVVEGPLSGTVVVTDPTAAQYAWSLVPTVVLLVLAVVAARLLLGVVRSLRTGDPFTVQNARRLASLSGLVIVGGFALPLVAAAAHARALDPLLADGATSWTVDLHLWVAVPGILIGFLAEVFSRGARLREDVEGLV